MLMQTEFIKKIKDFGLNSYEAKIWTALLSRGVSSAGELADISNVPRSRTYDVLESLEKKGFIMMKLGKPIKYMAISPNEVLERVKKKIKEESVRQEKTMDELKGSKILDELTSLHTQGIELVEPTDLMSSLKGRDNIYNQIELMIKDAKKSVLIITSSEGLIRKIEHMKKTLKKASDNGVKIKIAVPLTKETKAAADELKGIAEVRNITNIKARFVIVDDDQLTFMMMDDATVHPSYDVGIWVNTKLFATALKELFELSWKEMK